MPKLNLSDLSLPELQFHIEKLQNCYVECIDDDRLEEWPDFFIDQCLYKVISRENADRNLPVSAFLCDSKDMLIDRIVSLRHANVFAKHYYRHIISTINIKNITGGEISVQTNYAVFQTRLDGCTEIYNTGKYHDIIISTNNGLKFKEKQAIFDTYSIPSLMVTPI
jgi:anthranilate 1,2-dioxygenase small subunit